MTPATRDDAGVPSATLGGRYATVRGASEELCAPLETEDFVVQSMPDASPAKWHLAHTTWYFETFVLSEIPGYRAACSRARRWPRCSATGATSTRRWAISSKEARAAGVIALT
jgi:hypothetical protein